jgi:hypothetical protein
MLRNKEESFSVPEIWVHIAPTPLSAIAIGLQIICDGFPGFGHFADQKSWDSFSRRNGCNDQLDRNQRFARAAAKKRGKNVCDRPTPFGVSGWPQGGRPRAVENSRSNER